MPRRISLAYSARMPRWSRSTCTPGSRVCLHRPPDGESATARCPRGGPRSSISFRSCAEPIPGRAIPPRPRHPLFRGPQAGTGIPDAGTRAVLETANHLPLPGHHSGRSFCPWFLDFLAREGMRVAPRPVVGRSGGRQGKRQATLVSRAFETTAIRPTRAPPPPCRPAALMAAEGPRRPCSSALGCAFRANTSPPATPRLSWLIGFTRSAGFCAVTATEGRSLRRGRSRVQVPLRDAMSRPSTPVHWPPRHEASRHGLAERLAAGGRSGLDPWLHTSTEVPRPAQGPRRERQWTCAPSPTPWTASGMNRPAPPAEPSPPTPTPWP